MTESVHSAPGRALAWDGETVAAFDRGGEDVLVVGRAPLPGVAEVVDAARVGGGKWAFTVADAAGRAAAALASAGIECPALVEDIAALAVSFLGQFGVERALMRVEVVSGQPCPKFHCDDVHVRMLTTYHGPSTEYVRADSPDVVRSAPPFALTFLKGRKHPTHADTVHHRSPAVPPGQKRLCVIVGI